MSKKNIFYYGFNGQRRHIIDCLFKEHDWMPVVIFDTENMREWARETYKSAVFFEFMRLRSGHIDHSGLGKANAPIDAKIIGALSKYESFIFDLMEDTTGWNFSFHERRRYYYDLLNFFNTVIQDLIPAKSVAASSGVLMNP